MFVESQVEDADLEFGVGGLAGVVLDGEFDIVGARLAEAVINGVTFAFFAVDFPEVADDFTILVK